MLFSLLLLRLGKPLLHYYLSFYIESWNRDWLCENS